MAGVAAASAPLSRLGLTMETRTSAALEDPRALTLAALATAVRSGRISSVDVTRAYLDRIAEVNPKLNAVVQLRRAAALDEAHAADLAPRGKRGALHGVPITIKDSLDTAGIITTGGTKGRAQYVPAEDATVVKRLRAAGAIIMGKTNTPDLTLSFETNNLVYGRTNNPYDQSRTSGGSSGGAGAIVSAGGSAFDVGSDTGGSIRWPSHCNGICGIKPTSGRVPRTGHIIDYTGATESLTHIGPLARHVDDLALILPIIAGPDGIDPHVVPAPLGDYRRVTVSSLRVGWFVSLPPLDPTPATAGAVERAVKTLEAAGCKSKTFGPVPESARIYEWYTSLFWADGGAAVLRLLDKWGSTESPLRDRAKTAQVMTPAELTARWEEIDRWRNRMLALFSDFDVIICPVNAGPAVPHGTFDRATAAFTQVFNINGWPSAVIRAGTSPEGLPIGVQCVAQPWREDVSLAVAAHLEKAFGAFPGPKL